MINDPSDTSFNPPQEDALTKAWDILSEHFDGVLLVVASNDDVQLEDGRLSCCHATLYHGGRFEALGMAEQAKDLLLHEQSIRP